MDKCSAGGSLWWSEVGDDGESGNSSSEVLEEKVSGILPVIIQLSGVELVMEAARR